MALVRIFQNISLEVSGNDFDLTTNVNKKNLKFKDIGLNEIFQFRKFQKKNKTCCTFI